MKETAMGNMPSNISDKRDPNSGAFLSSSLDTEIFPNDIVIVTE
jgi:hypothetical protein